MKFLLDSFLRNRKIKKKQLFYKNKTLKKKEKKLLCERTIAIVVNKIVIAAVCVKVIAAFIMVKII